MRTVENLALLLQSELDVRLSINVEFSLAFEYDWNGFSVEYTAIKCRLISRLWFIITT